MLRLRSLCNLAVTVLGVGSIGGACDRSVTPTPDSIESGSDAFDVFDAACIDADAPLLNVVICDPMGQAQCASWARETWGASAIATCTATHPAHCVLADQCPVGATGASDCTCGDHGACVTGTFCAQDGGIASCVVAACH